VKKSGEVVVVEVPRLAAAPAIVARDPQRSRHRLGLGVGAGSMAVVGIGVALGLGARSKWGSVGTHCDANHVCDAMGVSINHDARLLGNAGTIVGGVGLAALITSTVLYMTAPAARPVIEHAHLEVSEGSSVQIRFGGRF
jgi:hypothetical protein